MLAVMSENAGVIQAFITAGANIYSKVIMKAMYTDADPTNLMSYRIRKVRLLLYWLQCPVIQKPYRH